MPDNDTWLQGVRIPTELDRRVKAAAASNGRGVSAEVRALLIEALDARDGIEPQRPRQPVAVGAWEHL